MKLKSWLKELPYTLLQGSLETEVDEVVYDSRKAAPGTVFVCMRGANVDSHTFIPDVVEKGAPVLVVEHPVEAPENVTVIQVENGRNALSLLSAARFDYPARKMTAIGVTGTKGKTTTTYMIKAILEAAGQKTGLIGTNGAVIGENHYPTKNTTPESYILQEYFAKMVDMSTICASAFRANLTWTMRWRQRACAASLTCRRRKSAMRWNISRSMDGWRLYINQQSAP